VYRVVWPKADRSHGRLDTAVGSGRCRSEESATTRHPMLRWLAFAACLTIALALVPGVASGTSAGSIAAALRAKKTKAAAIEVQLRATRADLTTALARVDEVDAELQTTRDDLAATSDTLGRLDAQVSASQVVLNDRAVAIYQSGGLDVLEALLSVSSLDDLLTKMDLLSYIQETDGQLLAGLTTARDEGAFLQGQQSQRENDLIALRQEADARKTLVEGLIARQQALMQSVGRDIRSLVKKEEAARAREAAAAAGNGGVADPPVAFRPDTLISDSTFTDSGSLSAASIQAFLSSQSGALKSYSGRDHSGVTKTAAQMIADASSAWRVSPKVILVTLQKEQSLLSNGSPSQRALDWAMGCGKTDSSTLTRYQGFGNQIWGGARALHRSRSYWRRGISLTIDGNAVYPANAATHSLYRYTPHFHGARLFWSLYWRYFGDPIR
jgi:peptidoglycan hydrolase CwlO-like protein